MASKCEPPPFELVHPDVWVLPEQGQPEMSKKVHKPEEIVAKLRQFDVLHGRGMSMVNAIRQNGVSEVTYYRWRREFGDMKADQRKRLKELEKEYQRLRRAVSNLTLDKPTLAEATNLFDS